jgi:hypothetical protein
MGRNLSGRGSLAFTGLSVSVVLALAASCAAADRHREAAPKPRAALTVDVVMFGGPSTRDGGMAVTNRPVARANVTANDTSGRKTTALTGADGLATLNLIPGMYTVFSTTCGDRTGQQILLKAGTPARLQVVCAIP